MDDLRLTFTPGARVQKRLAEIRKDIKAMDDAARKEWIRRNKERAEHAGITWPDDKELALLFRLASIDGPFTAAQVGRRGWGGIRTTNAASEVLEQLVANGRIFRLPANRQGQTRYALTQDEVLGTLPEAQRGAFRVQEEQFSTFDALDGVGYSTSRVPVTDEDGDIWRTAKEIAFGGDTRLQQVVEGVDGLSPVQLAYAAAYAYNKVHGDHPVMTPIRGLANYLGMDYNALRKAIHQAERNIRKIEGA